MSGGGKTNTSTSTVAIPPEILQRYQRVNQVAEQAATQPFQQYSQDPNAFVAPLNQTQQAGIQNINNASGMAQPYYGAAAQLTARGTSQVNPEELDIGKYMSPYTKSVADTTYANLRQQQQQEMSGQTANAIRSGAFGGDRSGLAAANLARQQTMGTAAAMAPIYQQGYGQALGAAQQQQGVGLAAEQANQARYLAAGQQFAGLGSGAQAAALQGGQAQMGAGQVQQTTEQAGRQALYNQFLQQQGYPFQVAQFLANIAMGTGALSGNTTTTTQPAPFFSDRRLKEGEKEIGRTHDGQPIYKFRYKGDDRTQIGLMAQDVEKKHPEAVGLAAGYKTVDYDKATEDSERGRYADGGFAEILAHQQQMYGLGAPSGLGAGASMSGSPGSSGYVKIDPNVSISRQLIQPTKHAPPPPNLTQELQAGLGAANTISGLAKSGKEGWDWMKGKMSDTPAEKSRGGLAGGGMPYAGPDDPLSDVVKEGKQQIQPLKGATPPGAPKSGLGEVADLAKTAGTLGSAASGLGEFFSALPFFALQRGGVAGRHAYADGGDPAMLDPDLPAPGVIEVAGEAPAGLLPRSVRNNNPGNLEASPFTQKLPGYVGSDGRFARFESPEHGAAAMDTLLQNYGRKGLVTPAAIVNRWSPDADRTNAAGTEGRYAGHIAKTLGIRPDEPIDMNNPDARRGLAAAMAAYESGAGNPPGLSRAPAGSSDAPAPAPARAAPSSGIVAALTPEERPAGEPWTGSTGQRFLAPGGNQPRTKGGLMDVLTSEKFLLPLMSGLGAMASSPSRYLGAAALTGLGGAANTYAKLASDNTQQTAEMGRLGVNQVKTQAELALQLRQVNAARQMGGLPPITVGELFSGTSSSVNPYEKPTTGPVGSPSAETSAGPAAGSAAAGVPAAPASTVTEAPKSPLKPTGEMAEFLRNLDPEYHPDTLKKRADELARQAQVAFENGDAARGIELKTKENDMRTQLQKLPGSPVMMKDGSIRNFPGAPEAAAQIEATKDAARKNVEAQVAMRGTLAAANANATNTLAAAEHVRDLVFDPKTGAPIVSTGPLAQRLSNLLGVARQLGVDPALLDTVSKTGNIEQLEKQTIYLGSQMAREALAGSQTHQEQFMQFLRAVPNSGLSPQAIKSMLDDMIVPQAKQTIKVWDAVKDLPPTGDYIGTRQKVMRDNPWYEGKSQTTLPPTSERKVGTFYPINGRNLEWGGTGWKVP